MDNELIRIFSEELRETRNLARAAEAKADACWAQVEKNGVYMDQQLEQMREQTQYLRRYTDQQVEQLRELVIITRNQVKEEIAFLKLPWWKKLFGISTE